MTVILRTRPIDDLKYFMIFFCCFKHVQVTDSCSRQANEDYCIPPPKKVMDSAELAEHFRASMLLSGVGDAMGYRNGRWEFNYNGTEIHKELQELGGIENLQLDARKWRVSDDTVMHIATAKGLVGSGHKSTNELYLDIAQHYIDCMKDMSGRAPGGTCIMGTNQLKPKEGSYFIPYNPQGGGCGGAMRSMCIGLYYSREDYLDNLIAVSIESGRMTHNNPTGYLGSLASALFTSYAIQRNPIEQWGSDLMKVLEKAKEYIKLQNRDVEENMKDWGYFTEQWKKYLKKRGIEDGFSPAKFPDNYGVAERDQFYKSVSFSGWGGSAGHDAPMIAYDALLGSGNDWKTLCERGMLHGGDNDGTGAISAAWFGALYGFKGVPENHFKNLEYRDVLEKLAEDIFKLRPEVREAATSAALAETAAGNE